MTTTPDERAGAGPLLERADAAAATSPDEAAALYRELLAASPELVAARLELDTTLSVASRDALFPLGEIEGAEPHANYGIAPDGGFVMIRRTQLPKLVLIQNVDRALADRP